MNHAKRVRYWLKRLLCWVVVPIRGGPLAGWWFGLFTGTRFLSGRYGADEVDVFQRLIKPGDVVFDIGAHVGYFSLLASRIVGSQGRVLAFEPLPVNLAYLARHKRVNRRANLEILEVAVGGRAGRMALEFRSGTGRGRLSAEPCDSQLHVRVVSLDGLFDEGVVPAPNFIKMDVEGAECDALRGARQLLARFRPTIILSLHGAAAKRDCETILASLGYRLSYLKESILIASPIADAAENDAPGELRRAA
jgi:FkbM family methyltransferase